MGSPKRKGNTAKVLSMFQDKVKTNHEIEIIHITKYKVGGCLGCYQCQENKDEPGCVQKDDAPIIFDKMIQALERVRTQELLAPERLQYFSRDLFAIRAEIVQLMERFRSQLA